MPYSGGGGIITTIGGDPGGVKWDPANTCAGITLSNFNLTATGGAVNNVQTRSTTSHNAFKFYWEVRIDSVGANTHVGIVTSAFLQCVNFMGQDLESFSYFANNNFVYNNAVVGNGDTYTDGDIIGIALDIGNLKIWFRKNNNSWDANGAHDPATNTGGFVLTPAGAIFLAALGFANTDTGKQMTGRFLASQLSFAIPSTFVVW